MSFSFKDFPDFASNNKDFPPDLFPIDLRSDPVTKPSVEMRKVMSEAEVGDDVYGEDPTVIKLENTAAELLGKEAALYVTSGTQGNLVSILTHCSRGDGVMLGRSSHIFNYEGGGLCALGGMVPILLDDSSGLPVDLDYALPSTDNVHFARAKLLCLENTHNKSQGNASSPEEISEAVAWAHKHRLSVHMDGARLFNAAAAQSDKPSLIKNSVKNLVKNIDSVQICLSKGLGAPIGSLICASSDFIREARFWRKKVGGGLRQVGIVASAGLFALEHNIERLADDHANARAMTEILKKIDGGKIKIPEAKRPTNMIYFSLPDKELAEKFHVVCLNRGVFFGKTNPVTFRLVTHLDITYQQAEAAAKIIAEEIQAL